MKSWDFKKLNPEFEQCKSDSQTYLVSYLKKKKSGDLSEQSGILMFSKFIWIFQFSAPANLYEYFFAHGLLGVVWYIMCKFFEHYRSQVYEWLRLYKWREISMNEMIWWS